MFSRIAVDYYGAMTPINQLASINIPEARMVIIKPYDQGSLKNLEKAIRDSDLGVNPSNDGQIIRIVVPQLSEERRREMVKVARGKGEDARVTIRSLRRKAMEELHRIVRDGEAGEDEVGRAEKELQATVDKYVHQIDELGEAQGSRAARGLMTASHPETPAVSGAAGSNGRKDRGKDRASGRAGRNLIAAIGVGVGLGAVVLASLLIERHWFIAVVALAAAGRHLGAGRGAAAAAPTSGCRCRCCSSAGRRWSVAGLAVRARRPSRSRSRATALGVLLWRMPGGAEHYVRDVTAGVFTAAYVPLLCSFAALMVVAPDGAARVLVFVICVVASDVGGYTAGVLAGKHPMAPTISPKKSWEGFAGSLFAGMVAGALSVVFLLHGPWWAGVLTGALLVVSATLGDLVESLMKRDIGIKDMGTLLPGHGGRARPARLAAAHGPGRLGGAQPARSRVRIPSPNIWHWPEVYAQENAAQDVEGAVWAALRDAAPWTGRGRRRHRLVATATTCASSTAPARCSAWSPTPPLVQRAQADGLPVVAGEAARLPLASASVDLVHARTAYFFGKGCEPGLAEAWRVLRPGGAARDRRPRRHRAPYGEWMRADIPHYDPVAAERFFTGQGFSLRRIPTTWRFPDRATCAAVLRIEFSTAVADRALAQCTGLTIPVGYRLHVRHKRLAP
jgi:phosphatidate cytidylyltransferase